MNGREFEANSANISALTVHAIQSRDIRVIDEVGNYLCAFAFNIGLVAM